MLLFRLQLFLHNFQGLAVNFQGFVAKLKHGSSFQPDDMNMRRIGHMVLRQNISTWLIVLNKRVIVLINDYFDR